MHITLSRVYHPTPPPVSPGAMHIEPQPGFWISLVLLFQIAVVRIATNIKRAGLGENQALPFLYVSQNILLHQHLYLLVRTVFIFYNNDIDTSRYITQL